MKIVFVAGLVGNYYDYDYFIIFLFHSIHLPETIVFNYMLKKILFYVQVSNDNASGDLKVVV